MRLLEIRIKNIASLKGEHEISFREIMQQSPLFAITGETGSGKSTILNSIGLALYGKIFKTSIQQNDVVTLGEKEGQIELLFQARDKTYLAFWRARVRKQNGEFYSTPQSPTRDLYEVQGDSLDSPKQISDKKVEDILNLDFDQFCKCVILNQGEFAKFLTSSFTDRKEILEKLYPGDILEGLSGQLRMELEESRNSLRNLDVTMSTLKDDSPGENLETSKSHIEAELKRNESILTLLEGLDSSYKTLHHYFDENVKNQNKLTLTQADVKELTRTQNENFLTLKASQELHETTVKNKEKEEPRLQELLKLEEKLQSSLEIDKDLSLKLARKEKELENGLERQRLSSESLKIVALEISTLKQKIVSPVDLLKSHQEDLELLLARELEKKHLSEAKLLADQRIKELEDAGKEKSSELQVILNKKKDLPHNLENELQTLTQKKDSVFKETEKKNKALIQESEINLQRLEIETEEKSVEARTVSLKESVKEKLGEASPLRTTLELSELMSAVEICRKHPTTVSSGVCPTCETQVDQKKWSTLRESLKQNDLGGLKLRLDMLDRELIRLDEEEKTLIKMKAQLKDSTEKKKRDLEVLRPILSLVLDNVSELEEKIKALSQRSWELKQLNEAENKLNLSLQKAREDFAQFRKDHQVKIKNLESKETELKILKEKLSTLIPLDLDEKAIQIFKTDLQLIKELRIAEVREEKLLHEKSFLEETLGKIKSDVTEFQRDLSLIKTSILEMNQTLKSELNGEKASEKIFNLNQKVKTSLEESRSVEARSKKFDLIAKEASSRLQLLGEQSKDLELQFIKAREDIRRAPLYPEKERETLTRLLDNLKNLTLDLSSPAELFIPLKELLLSEKGFYKDSVSNLRENLAGLVARLHDWEKRQDKIKLLELKSKDVMDKLARLERLESVLGKDELRTFVLSLVEENLIQQTNEELLKLCQGRYEIIHQSRSRMKLTPEFYVLDKFREGGLRKVATLSGGETFMVSLAMALGLAEMTRGQAEIDSLFIDEGFGTLDQDSLEDVLEMLNQIQTRGLMVGVISHIKGLTNSIPLNLLLSKKQDGTSTLSLQYN